MEKIPIDRASANEGRPPRRILVTGATGAVGRYVVDELLASGDSVIAVTRDRLAARGALPAVSTIHVVEGDVADGGRLTEQLPPVDAAILLAAAWDDGPAAWSVNTAGQVELATALAAQGCHRVVWFGTASVLDHAGRALAAATQFGTPYIASKAVARQRLLDRLGDELRIVHPTVVVAGDATHPGSHVARLVPALRRHAWLAQYVTGDGSLHVVHARDLACMARDLAHAREAPGIGREMVAGTPPISLEAVLDLLLEHTGRRRRTAIDLTPRRARWLIRLLRARLSAWDEYCLAMRHFRFDSARLSVRDEDTPHFPTARSALVSILARQD